jgi:hypothetical protein
MTPRTSRGSGQQLEISSHRPIRCGSPRVAAHQRKPVLRGRYRDESVIHGTTGDTTCGQSRNKGSRTPGAEEAGVREVDLDQPLGGLRREAVRGSQSGEHGVCLESRKPCQTFGPADERRVGRGVGGVARLHEGKCRTGVEQARLEVSVDRQDEAHGRRRRSGAPHQMAAGGGHRVRQAGRC